MIGDAIALLDFIRNIYNIYSDRKVLSALFDWDGSRLEGDERIVVHVHADKEKAPNEWYYSIQPLEDYEFIRIPVNLSAVIESLGYLENMRNRDADYFRYIQVPDGLMRFGGTMPNVKVRFMVFAYKKSDLLSLGKGKIP